MKRSLLLEIIVMLFIILFVYAAGTKLLDYEKFRTQLEQSPLLTSFADGAAWFIPSTEIMVAIMLALPRFQQVGLYAAFSLMILFTGYIGLALLQIFGDLPCSCGGVLSSLGWKEHFLFNILFTLLALAGILIMKKRRNKMQALSIGSHCN